ncbi:MAG TPA: HesA/MoeB/ThiF family protein [Verrucomicrobiales bacterium]|nr:HesA/MoeB/ThiF family protein [Verrucomicrobiales bacterium]
MSLTDTEQALYEWQIIAEDFGVEGQGKLKNSTVFISRCGGLGGLVAYELAAAGIGGMVVAHAGDVKHSDLNRQLLMSREGIGKNRMQSITGRLKELNPDLELQGIDQNVGPENVKKLISGVDIIVDCAPLFEERFAMNQRAIELGIPMVECSMYECEAHITSFKPGLTGCLRCLYPEIPPYWTRKFPVFGAVSGMVGCLGAMEVIKIISGLGRPLFGNLLCCDLKTMSFRKNRIFKDPDCSVCGSVPSINQSTKSQA